VVAVNGRIIWADIFASTELLEKYWPKLVRSYASEAVVTRAKGGEASLAQAEAFLGDMEGRREPLRANLESTVTQKSMAMDSRRSR